MTTPANFNTPDRIIRMGLKDAGLLQEGDDPSPEQFADGMNRLNDLINFWQTQGIKVWLQSDLTVPLVAGKGTYTLGPTGDVVITKPTRVLDEGAFVLDVNSQRRPIIAMSKQEYDTLSQVTEPGSITSFWAQKLATSIVVKVWLVPDSITATGSMSLPIQQQVTNMVSVNDQMNFPQEWFLALRWGFADEICTGQPQAIMDRCEKKATMYREALEDWDVEDTSTRFQPDTRMGYGASNFRG